MNNRFDELGRGLTRVAPRRWALKKFGVGLAGMALVCGVITAWGDSTPPESSVTVVILDAFATGDTNGAYPGAPLVVGADGALYGLSAVGGTSNKGTLFRLQTDGTFTKLHDFNGSDGNGSPAGALAAGPGGVLYGSTWLGGASGDGTLFRVETNGTFTKLHDFNWSDGMFPRGVVVAGPDGAVYGVGQGGGASYNGGTLFRLGTNGSFTKLHDFNGTDGNGPGVLVVGPDGALYGTTGIGGTNDNGTLFRMGTNGSFTNAHDFNGMDGSRPNVLLSVGPDGALYGSCGIGGSNNRGTLFRLETNGNFTKVHDFSGSDGAGPWAALVVGADGALYGSTYSGGTSDYGTVFRLETNGTFTKLHDFNGTNDGVHPSTDLVMGPDGELYGSTQFGSTNYNSTNNSGTLFRVETNGGFTELHHFNGTDGRGPVAPLVLGPDGALYGSEPYGGPKGGGVLFKLVLNRPPVARCHDVIVSAGGNCTSDASVDNGSFDPDAGDTITVRQEPPGPYPVGTNQVTLIVTDNRGASNSCAAIVTVMDTTPPTIGDVGVTPNVLWPPNGKMVEVAVNYTATDDCGGVSNVLVVSSNEAGNGASNGTSPEWVVEDEHHVKLRAERAGAGNGRVYTVTVISTDTAGNSSTKTVTVSVPKNQK
jgi:uncharacterized repeat protein (TIGR03803 family)